MIKLLLLLTSFFSLNINAAKLSPMETPFGRVYSNYDKNLLSVLPGLSDHKDEQRFFYQQPRAEDEEVLDQNIQASAEENVSKIIK
ncbi:hypothetical protein P618_201134 [Holospora obtusa F1]|uniref:Secreted protein n=1 Tax=Holospora obtusa F1 TaxID=1399147 RepID=W6TCZ1_HOLOB|nr:hypothetical protein [Holospora obtusa]ETZ06693.1 hypothetical protein P618_201134 [Holospora obtusa F1]